MIVKFLGTGTSQGVPVIACNCEVCQSIDFKDKRLRSSVYVEIDGKHLVIDTGPDFRQQMLRERINRLDAILFTHEHKDHTAGLDDVRAFNFAHDMDMPLYAEQRVHDQLKVEFAYAFAEKKYPGVPRLTQHPIDESPFLIGELMIEPIRAKHYKLPVLGFRIKDFVYVTDANFIDDENLEKMKNAKVLVLNALRLTEHISHFNIYEALEIVQKVHPEKAYFTHISHLLGRHGEIEKGLPEHVFLAYDGLSLDV